jgi:hypothetical protein
MRDTLRLLGIIALAVIIGFSMVACDNGSTDSGDNTPVASDFNITGNGNQSYTGNPIAVTITPKEGKSSGAITVFYNNAATAPSNTGSYAVTFNVAAATGWKAAEGLAGGALIITNTAGKSTPVAADYTFNGQVQTFDDTAKRLGIVPISSSKSNGLVTIYYDGSVNEPKDIGTYTVTFDVAATDLWNSATGLAAGSMQIVLGDGATVTPVRDDFIIIGLGDYTEDLDSPRWVYVYPKDGKSKGNIKVLYNGSEDQPTKTGSYEVWFDVTASPPWGPAHIYAGPLTISDGKIVEVGWFDISGLNQAYDGTPKAVRVTAKVDHQTLIPVVKYQGVNEVPVTNVPYQVGTYIVTFDVPKVAGYQATKESLPAGVLTIAASKSSTAPTPANFNVTGLGTFQFDAQKPRVVSVKASSPENDGPITVKYSRRGGGSVEKPVDTGTYDVTFDVGRSVDFGAATLSAGELTIYAVNPYYLEDYVFSGGPFNYDGQQHPAVITSPTLGSGVVISSILYNGGSSQPVNAGEYEVTFNIAASANWQAASGIKGGTLTINKGYPKLEDYDITQAVGNTYDGSVMARASATRKTVGLAVSDGAISFTYNGEPASATYPVNAAVYEVAMNVAASESGNWESVSGMKLDSAEIKARTPGLEHFITVAGGLEQEAYSVMAITFRANPDAIPRHPSTATLGGNSAVSYAPSANINVVNNAGPGTYPVTLTVPANSPNWTSAQLRYELKVGALEFLDVDKFVEWLNTPKTANQVYSVKFARGTITTAAQIKAIADAMRDPGTTVGNIHSDNRVKLLKLDLGEAITTLDTLVATGTNGANKENFSDCANLVGLDLARSSIANFDANTFAGCTRLRELKLPNTTVTAFPDTTLQNCIALAILDTGALATLDLPKVTLSGTTARLPLTDVTLSTGIGADGPFKGMNTLKTLTLGTGAGSIPANSFENCTALTTVKFPAAYGANLINASAFKGCDKLTTVVFPATTWTGAAGAIGASAFENCVSLADVNIPILTDNASTIANDAFKNTGLKTLTLGNGVFGGTAFGTGALTTGIFKEQKNLEKVTLLDGITSIPESAFENCPRLLSVEFPEGGFAGIGIKAFKDCGILVTDIPSSVTALGTNAFENCKAITKITIPAIADFTIPVGAFKNTGLTSVKLPDTITTIAGNATTGGGGAFENCVDLVSVDYGTGLTTIQTMAFAGCKKLNEFIVDPTVIADRGKVILVATVTVAPVANAFKGCEAITEVEIITPATGLSYVGEIFSGCTNLTKLKISGGATAAPTMTFGSSPNNVTSIKEIVWNCVNAPSGVFTGCTGLETLTVSQTLAASTGIFAGTVFTQADNTNFKTLKIEAAQTSTGALFVALPNRVANVIVGYDTTGNTAYTLGASTATAMLNVNVNNIEFTGPISIVTPATTFFASLTGPITVSINADPGANFAGVNTIRTVNVGPKTPLFGATAFPSNTLREITVDGANDKMGNYQSDGVLYQKNASGALINLLQYPPAKQADTYTISPGVEVLGAGVFASTNTRMKELTIPASIRNIGGTDTFDGLTHAELKIIYNAINATSTAPFPATMKFLEIGSEVKNIPADFLGANSALENLKVPESVTNIGDGAFATAAALINVEFNAADYQVGGDVFGGDNEALLNVTFGPRVTVVRASMFNGVTTLSYVGLPDSVTSIETLAFNGCTALSRVAIPANVVTIAASAFAGCTGLNEVIFKGANTGIAAANAFTAGGDLITKYAQNGKGWYRKNLAGSAWDYLNGNTIFD